ncbi:MAG: LPS export ABC transporter periplasmic protein LptC [Flavobacteriales bacterium]
MKNISALVPIAITLFASCKNDIQQVRAITEKNTHAKQVSYNATYTFSEKGKKQTRLEANLLEQFDLEGDEDYLLASNGFSMLFFDSLGREEARITARNGKYEEKKKLLTAWDSVVLSNSIGEKLETEELIYMQDSARIVSDKFVTITLQGGTLLRGRGLESNDSFTSYRIMQPTGDIIVDENTQSSNGENK